MILFKCDVCGSVRESITSSVPHSGVPTGWRFRCGRSANRHAIRVHACSEACAKKYDHVEADQLGFGWSVAEARDAPVEPARPLTMPKDA